MRRFLILAPLLAVVVAATGGTCGIPVPDPDPIDEVTVTVKISKDGLTIDPAVYKDDRWQIVVKKGALINWKVVKESGDLEPTDLDFFKIDPNYREPVPRWSRKPVTLDRVAPLVYMVGDEQVNQRWWTNADPEDATLDFHLGTPYQSVAGTLILNGDMANPPGQ